MQTSKSFQKTKVYTNIQELSKFLVASPGKWASDFRMAGKGTGILLSRECKFVTRILVLPRL